MLTVNRVLLSIIIPTKNRQSTCLAAVESALRINANDIEIIIQDCSNNKDLEDKINRKFGKDPRLSYQYSDTDPSMTENWNAAFNRANGEYFCAIGDDDAIVPVIYPIVKWAKDKGKHVVVQKKFVTYTWPGFEPQPHNGTLAMEEFTGELKELSDFSTRIVKFSDLTDPMSYITLPQAYHTVFSRDIKDKLEEKTKEFLMGTSVDVYSAVAFNSVIDTYTEVDIPFTIRGASQNSNSQRLFDGRSREHLNEYRNLDYPEFLPDASGLYITVAESLVTACKNTGQEYLINNIDLPVLYANIALQDQPSYKACREKLYTYVKTPSERRRFFKHYRASRRSAFLMGKKEKFFTLIKKRIPFVYKIYRKLFPLHSTRLVVHAPTIIDALEIVNQRCPSFKREESQMLNYPV